MAGTRRPLAGRGDVDVAPSQPLDQCGECLAARLGRSMAWMLEAAGISSSGCTGSVKVNGLALLYLDAIRAWMNDDSPDMARTMAAVDKGLRRAEQIARRLPSRSRRAAREPTGSEPPVEETPPAPAV